MRARPRRSDALTLVELIIGMAMTTLVLGALAAFTSAAGQGWMAAEAPQGVHLKAMALQARLRMVLKNALGVTYVNPGSADPAHPAAAGVMVWLKSGFSIGGVTEGVDDNMQLAEMGWLEYNPATHTLTLYRPMDVIAGGSNAVRARNNVSSAASSAAFPNQFKLMGGPFMVAQTLADDVSAAWFEFHNQGDLNGRPAVEFVIRLRDQASNGGRVSEAMCYGNAVLENPKTQ